MACKTKVDLTFDDKIQVLEAIENTDATIMKATEKFNISKSQIGRLKQSKGSTRYFQHLPGRKELECLIEARLKSHFFFIFLFFSSLPSICTSSFLHKCVSTMYMYSDFYSSVLKIYHMQAAKQENLVNLEKSLLPKFSDYGIGIRLF